MSYSRFRIPDPRFHISDFGFQMSDSRFRIPDSMFHISYFIFQITDSNFHISDYIFQSSGFRFHISTFRFQIPYSRFYISDSIFQMSYFIFQNSDFIFQVGVLGEPSWGAVPVTTGIKNKWPHVVKWPHGQMATWPHSHIATYSCTLSWSWSCMALRGCGGFCPSSLSNPLMCSSIFRLNQMFRLPSPDFNQMIHTQVDEASPILHIACCIYVQCLYCSWRLG